MNDKEPTFDPELDLVLERFVDVPAELVWRAWTEPELIKQWFSPRPWTTTEAEVDLWPGGKFRTVMRGPESGQESQDGTGCILEVIPNRLLTWTTALGPDFRPQADTSGLVFTASIIITPNGSGTDYKAIVRHRDADARRAHSEMGFAEGWGAALEQLVELTKQL